MADPDISSGRAMVVDSVASVGARFYRAHTGNMSPPGIIGFYRLAIAAGSTLIANQLDLGDSTVGRVLRELPVGSVLHKWDASSLSFVDNVKLDSCWSLPEMDGRRTMSRRLRNLRSKLGVGPAGMGCGNLSQNR